MEHLSSAMEQQNQVQWRRDKIQELCSKGYSQREISQILQVGLATVNRDISYLRNEAKTNIKIYIDERLPEEYEKCLVGLNACPFIIHYIQLRIIIVFMSMPMAMLSMLVRSTPSSNAANDQYNYKC
ncbi:MAG: hypothetical protein ACJ71A_14435 [Nitrososphaeraceae archaeon]